MMEMCFHFRISEPILFKEWVPGNMTAYVFSCIAVGTIAFAYELIKFGRTRIDSDSTAHDCCDAEIHLTEDTDAGPTRLPYREIVIRANSEKLRHRDTKPFRFIPTSLTRGQHVASCITYFVQTFGSYCLMMISMTYNVPIVLSMLLGHVLAFLILSPLTPPERRQENDDCCG